MKGSTPTSPALTIDVHLTAEDLRGALERDVRSGLGAARKSLSPKWFYDEEGSKLFEEITELPEYYPTRAERALLQLHAAEITGLARSDTLVELGAGSCEKTRLLLDALAGDGNLHRYVPFDVSAEFLRASAANLAREYEGLQVHAVVGDFLVHLDKIPAGGRRIVAFLGGTIGNLVPYERHRFLLALREGMGPCDHLLLGTDLVKEVPRMLAAYDDAEGVTARFNRNLLSVVNRELDADLVPQHFDHVVRWDPRARWIEMRLRSQCDQLAYVGALGMSVAFARGEEMVTEISAKFTAAGVGAELARAGFVVDRRWGAGDGEFMLTLAHPGAPGRSAFVTGSGTGTEQIEPPPPGAYAGRATAASGDTTRKLKDSSRYRWTSSVSWWS